MFAKDRRSIIITICVAAVLLLSGCVTSSVESGEDASILGDPATSGLDRWPGFFQAGIVDYDIDGDGVKEIIAHSGDRKVYVFDSQTGHALAVLKTHYPPAWYVQQVTNAPSVGVLEPGDPPSIVIGNHASYVSAWRFMPDESTSKRFVFDKTWEVRTDRCYRSPGMDARPVLGDLTGDGRMEILVQTEEMGLFALGSDGSTLWSQCWSGGNGAPVIVDMDGDGDLDTVWASDSGFLSVLEGATGDPLWTFNARDHGIHPASVPVSPTVADLDGDGVLEVLFIARHAPEDDPEKYDDFRMGIFAVHQSPKTWQPEVVWKLQPEWANPISYTQLVVHDVDDDGIPDIFGMDWNTIGHRPGDWERLGPGNAFRLTAEGEVVWVREVDAWWSNKDIAIADMDGDGEQDLVVNGPRAGVDGLWRLDPATGASLGFLGTPGWKLHGGPLFLDLRGDGAMQVAYRATAEGGQEGRGGILLYELDTKYDAPVRGIG